MTDGDYWNKLNEDCEERARAATGYCLGSWGYGGPEAQWRMYVFPSPLHFKLRRLDAAKARTDLARLMN
jgi:hypothetical protein